MKSAVWAILIAGVLCGTALRFHGLERQSLWDDEMSTRKDVYLPLAIWPAVFHRYEMHPPLYFLQLRGWQQVFGDSLKSQRANSAFWGSLTLVLAFLLMLLYQGPAAACIALWVLALSPYHLAYSQEMRPYAFAMALGVFGFLMLAGQAQRKRGYGFWIAFGGVLTAELYTHYWGSFVVVAQVLSGYLQARSTSEKKGFLITGALASVLFTAWIPTLLSQLRYVKELGFWVPEASPLNLVKTACAFTGLFFHHASLAFRAPGPLAWLIAVGVLTWGLAAYGIRKGPRALWIWLSVGLAIPYVLSYRTPSLYVWYRYPSLIYPAFVFLVAYGLAVLPRPLFRWTATALLVVTSCWSCYQYKVSWQKANPKAVVSYIQGIKQPDTLVIRPAYFAPLFAYYDQGKTVVMDQDKLSDPEKRAALKGKDFLLVAFEVPDDPVGAALLSQFKVVSSQHFPGYARLGVTVYRLQ